MKNYKKEFSEIYDQYIDKIYRFIFFKVNSQEIAEDLTSETFLRAWQAFQNQGSPTNPHSGQKEAQIENPSAFLYQIARNLVIDYYREKGRFQVVSAENTSIVDPGPNLEEKMTFNSDLEQIRVALVNLRDDYQNVIIWHYLDDLPIPEVAKMLGRTEQATRVLLHRALKALRNELH